MSKGTNTKRRNRKKQQDINEIEPEPDIIIKPDNSFKLGYIRILFFINNKHLQKVDTYNTYITDKHKFIVKCNITHPKKEESGISLILKSGIDIIFFNTIVNDTITFFNDKTIIFKYRSGKETTDELSYTYSNITQTD